MEMPALTDHAALARNRARAARAPVTFLHEAARDDLEDRLSMVNRDFTQPAVVSPLPEVWDGWLPGAVHVGPAAVLPFEAEAHDLIIHAMDLHWADDPVGQLIQCRRALKPDGLFLGILFGGRSLQELRAALARAESEVTGGLSPRVAPMAEIRDLGALLQRAGFALPVADSFALTVRYATALHLMRDLRGMGEANALTGRLRRPTRRSVILRAAEIYAEAAPGPGGGIAATAEFVVLTGWAPDASQPQPLRPGSATRRLAEALGTEETRIED
ncbi:SAM-dependent methyltransferase [Rhodosalinus halophilus]|uniref:SAM-dependent methyltransferase n=1 Tax=Rhodosalinus halophilus TaxID=2259333 RepID=A0A365U8D5_9RHOB|nr:methyltransferase domain-containing protein [Rhodosalinus halophilus]RBI84694.1 SAM-dependent methyltransferase [Rhodosalinus halophilus]